MSKNANWGDKTKQVINYDKSQNGGLFVREGRDWSENRGHGGSTWVTEWISFLELGGGYRRMFVL